PLVRRDRAVPGGRGRAPALAQVAQAPWRGDAPGRAHDAGVARCRRRRMARHCRGRPPAPVENGSGVEHQLRLREPGVQQDRRMPMTFRGCLTIGALSAAMTLAAGCAHEPQPVSTDISPATNAAEAGMVDAAVAIPGLDTDIRYAGEHNFTGGRVDGYDAAKYYVHAQVADALARVEDGLRKEGLRLAVFACHRPLRPVKALVRLARQ